MGNDKLRLWHLFIVGRSAVTGVILALLWMIHSLVLPLPQRPLFVLAGVQFAANGFYLYLWKRRHTTILGYLCFGAEIVLITLLIFFLGPDGYAFMLAYLWPIIMGGWLIGRKAILPLTLLSGIAYAILVYLGRHGLIYAERIPEPGGTALTLILNLPYLAFISLLVWLLTTEMEGNEENLALRNQELHRINTTLRSLVLAGEELLSCLDLSQLLSFAVRHIEQITGHRRVAIYLRRGEELYLEQASDLPPQFSAIRQQTLPPEPWRDAEAAQRGSAPVVQELLGPEERERLALPGHATPRALTHIALRSLRGLEGMLTIVPAEVGMLGAGEAQVLQILGHQLGTALENARLVGDLQHDRKLLRGILAHMAEGVFVANREDQVLLANRAAMSLLQVVEGETLPAWFLHKRLAECEAGAVPEGRCLVEYLGRMISISTAELPGSGGVPVSTIYVARDITEEARVEQMKSDFVAYASHELRTPLTTIKMLVRLLLMDVPPESKQQEYLSVISTQVERQRRLVSNLLDFTRLEAGQYELPLETIDPRRVIQSAASICRPLAEEKGLRLEVQDGDAPLALWANAGGLEQVLINLLSNAIKFTDRGGQITITCGQDGAEMALTIQDTGVGMTPEQLGRIFQKFYTVRNPQKRGEGTGLGLVISNMIVQKLGGRIEVSSRVNEGSCFTVRLPLGDAADEARRESPSPTPLAAGPMLR